MSTNKSGFTQRQKKSRLGPFTAWAMRTRSRCNEPDGDQSEARACAEI
jgi:hypothetical protein